jgi:NTE family protein
VTSEPTIGVALGSGGARGLAHIPYIEAFDEMGLRPAIIAGTSIGALIGAGWASGMSGRQLREHAARVSTLQEIAGRLWTSSRASLKSIRESGVSVQVDARNIVDAYLPDAFPMDFADLQIPLSAVATDYFDWSQVIFTSGPLRPALAASLAIPALFRPVRLNGRIYIDGGTTNPLPLDQARTGTDILVGIDVNGLPRPDPELAEPNVLDVGLVATEIMTQSIVRQTLRLSPPDVYVRAPVQGVRVLEFWRAQEIIERAALEKDAFKRSLAAALENARSREAQGAADASPSGVSRAGS